MRRFAITFQRLAVSGAVAVQLTLISACSPDETISGYADRTATYALVEIDGVAVSARATISFPSKGEIVGSGPCNTYRASQTAPYPWFSPGPIAATRRACPDLAVEQALLQRLAAATQAEVAGDVLILTTDAGDMLVFQAE